jgi:hypothetical protein
MTGRNVRFSFVVRSQAGFGPDSQCLEAVGRHLLTVPARSLNMK